MIPNRLEPKLSTNFILLLNKIKSSNLLIYIGNNGKNTIFCMVSQNIVNSRISSAFGLFRFI